MPVIAANRMIIQTNPLLGVGSICSARSVKRMSSNEAPVNANRVFMAYLVRSSSATSFLSIESDGFSIKDLILQKA